LSLPETDKTKTDRDRGEAEPTKQVEQLNLVESAQVQAAGAVQPVQEKAPPGKMKVDLHCHTEASPDCSTPIELIPSQCVSKKIKVQAITDHNTIDGAVRLKKIAADTVDPAILTIIVGEEVSTQEGEIVGLFLHQAVPAHMTPEDTVKAIKEQGGLVLIPHGFDPRKRWRLKPPALTRIASQVDIIETFNARISNLKWNRAAVAWAKERGVLMSAGSDAHRLVDIGSAWVEVPHAQIRSPEDLKKVLQGGTPVGNWVPPALAYVLKMWDRTKRRIAAQWQSQR
jgi:predicted metal-dependent phosphoesterase TrpH